MCRDGWFVIDIGEQREVISGWVFAQNWKTIEWYNTGSKDEVIIENKKLNKTNHKSANLFVMYA